jgi:D-alanyl-D-alanine carboxypeptidase (penicillin-binding protein 5/6)
MRTSSKPTRIIAAICSTVFVAFIGIGTWNATRPLPVIAASLNALPTQTASADIAWPSEGVAAIGARGYGVLATHGDQTPRPIASITKVITALTVLQRAPLKPGEQGPTYTISQADADLQASYVTRDGSTVPVAIGEQLTEYQALQALMLPSANNIADSLAVWVYGSLDSYFAAANQTVKSLGMLGTTAAGDASGLSPATVSTPSDLIRLGEAALDNPVLASIVSQAKAELPVAGTVYNVNSLLGIEGIIGIKTGNSDEAGGCLLSAASYDLANGKKIIVVGAILGASVRQVALDQTRPLLASVERNFSIAEPIRQGQAIGTYTMPWGSVVTAVAKSDISFIKWGGDTLATKATLNTVDHGVKKGAKLGTVTVTVGDLQTTTDTIAKNAVNGPGFWWRVSRR